MTRREPTSYEKGLLRYHHRKESRRAFEEDFFYSKEGWGSGKRTLSKKKEGWGGRSRPFLCPGGGKTIQSSLEKRAKRVLLNRERSQGIVGRAAQRNTAVISKGSCPMGRKGTPCQKRGD